MCHTLASGRVVVFVAELSLVPVAVDERRHVEGVQLRAELLAGGVVVGVTQRVVHHLHDEFDDDLVKPTGVEGGHPHHGVAGGAIVGDVQADDFVGELLGDHPQQVWRAELLELVLGLDDRSQVPNHRLGDEPARRVDIGDDGVRGATVTGQFPHPHVDPGGADALPAGQRHRRVASRDTRL